jgi:putative Mn2+ efflux pump MntP
MSKRKQESLFWGIVLLIIGVLFLVDNLGFNIDIWDIIGDYWPIILIAIGIKNIWQHFMAKNQEAGDQRQA